MKKALIGTAFNSAFRFYLLRADEVINEAIKHEPYEFVTADNLSRALMMTLTLSLLEKREVLITSKITGNGVLKHLVTSSLKKGTARGYASPSLVSKTLFDDYSTSSALGKGELVVTRQYKNYKPYTSSIDLVNGTITDDYMYFFSQSDQVNTAILYGSLFDKTNFTNVTSILIQVLPNASDNDLFILEERIKELPAFSKLINLTDEEILAEIFMPKNYKILEEVKLDYYCNCSKDKFFNNLEMLDVSDLETLLKEDKTECICNFCNKRYYFTQQEINKIIKLKGQ